MFIPEERKQSTPTPILFMKQNALVFPQRKSSFMYSLFETAGCLEQFSQSARVCVCVCVCMHWCVCSRLSWYLGAVLRAILHLLSERSQEQGGDGRPLAAGQLLSPCGAGASCCWGRAEVRGSTRGKQDQNLQRRLLSFPGKIRHSQTWVS